MGAAPIWCTRPFRLRWAGGRASLAPGIGVIKIWEQLPGESRREYGLFCAWQSARGRKPLGVFAREHGWGEGEMRELARTRGWESRIAELEIWCAGIRHAEKAEAAALQAEARLVRARGAVPASRAWARWAERFDQPGAPVIDDRLALGLARLLPSLGKLDAPERDERAGADAPPPDLSALSEAELLEYERLQAKIYRQAG